MFWLIFFLIVFVASYLFTRFICHFALASHRLLDIPNQRSSHQISVPRGGGLAFVVCFLAAAIFLFCFSKIELSVLMALLLSGCFIALLGFWDDYCGIPAKWRFLGHFFACGLALYFLGGMPTINFFYWTLEAGLLCNLFGIFYLVWLLNLYNFMDGIDGLAAIEAMTVGLSSALIYYVQSDFNAMLLPLSLTLAVGGFLCIKFPARPHFHGRCW